MLFFTKWTSFSEQIYSTGTMLPIFFNGRQKSKFKKMKTTCDFSLLSADPHSSVSSANNEQPYWSLTKYY